MLLVYDRPKRRPEFSSLVVRLDNSQRSPARSGSRPYGATRPDWLRNRESTREKLYFTLMGTRANFLSNEHVQALNSIDVVFAKDKDIRDLWKKCLDHLATDENTPGFNSTVEILVADLYQAIGNRLGYRYTTDYIKRGIYFPKRHVIVQENQNKVLLGFAKAVESGTLKVEIVESQNTGSHKERVHRPTDS